MKIIFILLVLFQFSFSQINSTANPFFMGSSINFELLHYPQKFPNYFAANSPEAALTHGVQYLGGVYAFDDNDQFGFTLSNSTYNISDDNNSYEESGLNNLHLFYKSFLDEDQYYELGIIINVYEVKKGVDGPVNLGFTDISNSVLFYTNALSFNLAYGLKSDLNDNTNLYAVNNLEVATATGQSDANTQLAIRSLLGAEVFISDFRLSLNYKIFMIVSEDIEEFKDRFINTFYPQIKYNFSNQFEISANYQLYTRNDHPLDEYVNRIGFGFTAFFE